MYHEISMGMWDKMEGLRSTLEEGDRLTLMCENVLFSRTKIKPKDLEKYKRTKSEWIIDPIKAYDLGIIDEIIGAPLISKENIKKEEKRIKKQQKTQEAE
jgi:hypothetical protein